MDNVLAYFVRKGHYDVVEDTAVEDGEVAHEPALEGQPDKTPFVHLVFVY